jgi:hypothetical protein
MGMFKSEEPQSRNLAEVFPPGTPFRLLAALNQGMHQTSLGERLLFLVQVSAIENAEAVAEFGVWGSLAEQLTQLEAGELPTIVTLQDVDGVWRFAPHGPAPTVVQTPDGPVEQPQTVAVEAHIVPDAPTDSAMGAVQERLPPTPPPVDPAGGDRNPVPQEPPSVKPTPIDEGQTWQPGGGQPG